MEQELKKGDKIMFRYGYDMQKGKIISTENGIWVRWGTWPIVSVTELADRKYFRL